MQYERRWVSFPDLELRINWMYFYWTVFNAFLQGMLGGAVLGQIPNLVKHPSAIGSVASFECCQLRPADAMFQHP